MKQSYFASYFENNKSMEQIIIIIIIIIIITYISFNLFYNGIQKLDL